MVGRKKIDLDLEGIANQEFSVFPLDHTAKLRPNCAVFNLAGISPKDAEKFRLLSVTHRISKPGYGEILGSLNAKAEPQEFPLIYVVSTINRGYSISRVELTPFSGDFVGVFEYLKLQQAACEAKGGSGQIYHPYLFPRSVNYEILSTPTRQRIKLAEPDDVITKITDFLITESKKRFGRRQK
ncbi:MAG TPA: hypothetical protein VJH20_01360 [Candidatus Nanoarchaeia archaeon]|nr:hypothetical protein [Candidatus Nanoarchaeia archaeon]